MKKILDATSYNVREWPDADIAIVKLATGSKKLLCVKTVRDEKSSFNGKVILSHWTGQGSPSDWRMWTGFAFVNPDNENFPVVVWKSLRGNKEVETLASMVENPRYWGQWCVYEVSVDVPDEPEPSPENDSPAPQEEEIPF